MIKSRLEIYSSKDVKDRSVIVGEPAALKELAQTILRAADGLAGFHHTYLFKGNGHSYEILITKNVEEEEWQNMPAAAEKIRFIADYDEMRKSSINHNQMLG